MCIFIMATRIFNHLSNRRRHPHIIRFRDSFEEKVRGVGAKKVAGEVEPLPDCGSYRNLQLFFCFGGEGGRKAG